jgi:phage shock protein A
MSRIRRLFAKVGSLPAALLTPASDPRHAAVLAAQRQQEALALVRRTLGELLTVREGLVARSAALREGIVHAEQAARACLQGGHDEQARALLKQCFAAQAEAAALEQQAERVGAQAERLALSEGRLQAELEAFDARVGVLAARSGAAAAQQRTTAAIGRAALDLDDLQTLLDAVDRRAAETQSEAALADRMMEAGLLPDSDADDNFFNHRLAALEEQRFVDQRLAALKSTLGR